MANSTLDRLIKRTLFEQDIEESPPEKEEKKSKKSKGKDTYSEKEDDVFNKDISDIEKDDLKDLDKTEKSETVVVVNVNKKIKHFAVDDLINLYSVDSILNLFGVEDISNTPKEFGKLITIKIQSPLETYKDQKYTIKLMDKVGEVQINKPDFAKNFQFKSPIEQQNMEKATQAQLAPGKESESEVAKEEEKSIDISGYIEQLNTNYQQMVKNEFINRIEADYAS
jgi:hypothetical protein